MAVKGWRGAEISLAVRERAKIAIDETTELTAQEIVKDRWWESHRATGLVSEVVTEPARIRGPVVSGKVGTTRVRGFFGLFLERQRPFIRPAGDKVFPTLPLRLRGKL